MRNIKKPKDKPETQRTYLDCHNCGGSVERTTANIYELRCPSCHKLVNKMAQLSRGELITKAQAGQAMRLVREVMEKKMKPSAAIQAFAVHMGHDPIEAVMSFGLAVDSRREEAFSAVMETREGAQAMKLAGRSDWNDLSDITLYGVNLGGRNGDSVNGDADKTGRDQGQHSGAGRTDSPTLQSSDSETPPSSRGEEAGNFFD